MHSNSMNVSRFSNLSDHHHHLRCRGGYIRRHSPPPPPSHHLPKTLTLTLRRNFQISAITAATAQPSNHNIAKPKPLKIAIVGFGNFGQFLAKTLARQGHTVLAHSRTDYSAVAAELGVCFYNNPDDLCEEHPDVILLCTSILSTEKVLRSLPLERLKRSTLFVDVLSVKEFAKDLFLQILPPHFDVLCTHPMFGPESGKDSWKGLTFVYDKVRIGHDEARVSRCETFLDSFAKEGCVMLEMGCAEHDQHAAESQFITHTVGRILEKLDLYSTPINTKGYERLLNLVDNTSSDSFELYYGLFMYNKNSMEQLERLDLAFESLKKELFGHLHEILRKQLFGAGGRQSAIPHEAPVLSKLPRNGNGNKLSLNGNRNGNKLSLNGNGNELSFNESGNGLSFNGNGNRNKVSLNGNGNGNANGLSLNGNGNGHGLSLNGNVNRSKLSLNGNGLSLNGNGNGHGLSLNGNGNGSKLSPNGNENGNKNKLSLNGNENELSFSGSGNRNKFSLNGNGNGNGLSHNGNGKEHGLSLNGNGNGSKLSLNGNENGNKSKLSINGNENKLPPNKNENSNVKGNKLPPNVNGNGNGMLHLNGNGNGNENALALRS